MKTIIKGKFLKKEKKILYPIEGYEDYFITKNGEVWSKKFKRPFRKLKPYVGNHGYEVVSLCRKGVQDNPLVHRLVAQTFIPNPENKRTINHLNGIKTDNRVENIVWASDSENIQHAYNNGLNDSTRRKAINQYDLEGNFIQQFESGWAATLALGLNSSGNIANCCNGGRKVAYGYKWEYVDE